jgi:hydroxymethylpyrimidine/phosphomethylpyrimidine kinase
LTIAGSDSGGGAGIQADLKTIAALGAYGMSVITALTAQNGLGVSGIHAPEPDFVKAQMAAVLEGFPVAAAKTGMLFSTGIITALADTLENAAQKFPLVVDPVCVSQSGHQLLQENAVAALKNRMLPLAALLTPNRPEAELLAGMKIDSPEDIETAARRLLDMGAKAVLLKGGHFEAASHMTDWLALPGGELIQLSQPYVDTPNNHGTGCTLSAAIATGLGRGLPLTDAITLAQRYLNNCLTQAYAPGKGAGPPNHMGACAFAE